MKNLLKTGALLGVGLAIGLGASGASLAATPKSGGVLNFVVPSNPPSYDAHQETTFGVIHPLSPAYSLLIRVDPNNPGSPDYVCDLCEGGIPSATDGGKTYTFKIQSGVKFHDGTPLTSADVKASLDKIVFPPKGVPSSRKAFYKMVDSITSPDAKTLVIKLKYPSAAFMPALATPFNWIFSKKDLETHGYEWHKTNVNGTGPFIFKEHVAGSHIAGSKKPKLPSQGNALLRRVQSYYCTQNETSYRRYSWRYRFNRI